MAQKFSKYIFGGIMGAALAMLFSPKKGSEMRRMLMSAKDTAPTAEPPAQPTAVAEPVMVAEPSAAAQPDTVSKADLEARIEETRRQVESLLDQTKVEIAGKAGVSSAEAEMVAPPAAEIDESAIVELEEPFTEEQEAAVAPVPEIDEPEPDYDEIDGPDMIVIEEPQMDIETASGTSLEADEAEVGSFAAESYVSPIIDEAGGAWENDQWVAETVETDTAAEAPQLEEVQEEEPEADDFLESETVDEVELEAHLEEAIAEAEAAAEAETVAETEAEAHPEADETSVAAQQADESDIDYLSTPAEGEPMVDAKPGGLKPEDLSARSAPPEKPAFDREAMRRRIEETRSRLKAKAFDAMVQGESFINTEQESDSEGAKIDLDSESQHAIEKTLREED